jgi:hypothetical protein
VKKIDPTTNDIKAILTPVLLLNSIANVRADKGTPHKKQSIYLVPESPEIALRAGIDAMVFM